MPPLKTHTGDLTPPPLPADVLGSIQIPPNLPIVVVIHGIFQSANNLYDLCTYLTKICGFVVVILNRRGNDVQLSLPK